MTNLLRVAAAQFATGTDVTQNLATSLRMIDEAAASGAELVVLPEFCNHLSIYDDAAHAWEVAVEVDGPWFDAVSAKAKQHRMWIQINVTLRRAPASVDQPRARITNSNLVFDPDGTLRSIGDKTVLMGAENEYLSVANEPSAIVDASFGQFGSYACMDGVVPEVPRTVAVRGARLMLNSLNSFALDEATLHIPIRAAENRVWVIACCKVGPLLPPDKTDQFSQMMGVPGDMLSGAGESQIVAPDGTVVAKGPHAGEAIVSAEIDLDRSHQLRPDGTDIWASRRPVLYANLALPTPDVDGHARAESLVAATGANLAAVPRLLEAGAQLIVLPELAIGSENDLVALSSALAGTDAVVVSSRRGEGSHGGDSHIGVAVGASGVIGQQQQLHSVKRHPWSTELGDSLNTIDLPWGRMAIIVGDDVVYPEAARLAALESVDVLAIPMDAQEPWETRVGVIERAAENRMCVVAATPPARSTDDTPPIGRSLIADLPPDFTLWAPSRERTFDGTINQPDVALADDGGEVVATIHPSRSVHRQISRNTDLVQNRPWELFAALTDLP